MYYTFAVNVGQGVPMAVRGRFVRYWKVTTGEQNPAILIRGEGGLQVPLMPGQSFALPASWDRIVIENFDGVAPIAGILLIGDLEFTDNRIAGEVTVQGTVNVAGEVSVIDGASAVTLANEAFCGVGTCLAVAAKFSQLQVLNPVGSGKVVSINGVLMSADVAGKIVVRTWSTPLATLYSYGASKYVGGANALTEVRSEAVASVVLGKGLLETYCAANGVIDYRLKEPVVLAAGQGVVVAHGVVNTALSATFEFTERAV